MKIIIQNTETTLYLSYDAATDLPLWVEGTATATRFTQDAATTTLAILNQGLPNSIYVGRPGDRGGIIE